MSSNPKFDLAQWKVTGKYVPKCCYLVKRIDHKQACLATQYFLNILNTWWGEKYICQRFLFVNVPLWSRVEFYQPSPSVLAETQPNAGDSTII